MFIGKKSSKHKDNYLLLIVYIIYFACHFYYSISNLWTNSGIVQGTPMYSIY